jgi:hypothetical protein
MASNRKYNRMYSARNKRKDIVQILSSLIYEDKDITTPYFLNSIILEFHFLNKLVHFPKRIYSIITCASVITNVRYTFLLAFLGHSDCC